MPALHAALINTAAKSFDGELSPFWLNGDLVISPLEQLSLLERFFCQHYRCRRSTSRAMQTSPTRRRVVV